MSLIFERIYTDGIAELSYLVGDDSEGVAAVFDPRPDVDCYLQLAREKQVSITHVFKTHIYVDDALPQAFARGKRSGGNCCLGQIQDRSGRRFWK